MYDDAHKREIKSIATLTLVSCKNNFFKVPKNALVIKKNLRTFLCHTCKHLTSNLIQSSNKFYYIRNNNISLIQFVP
jgi:hypothetical protein